MPVKFPTNEEFIAAVNAQKEKGMIVVKGAYLVDNAAYKDEGSGVYPYSCGCPLTCYMLANGIVSDEYDPELDLNLSVIIQKRFGIHHTLDFIHGFDGEKDQGYSDTPRYYEQGKSLAEILKPVKI